MRPILWAVLAILVLQAVVLSAVYLVYRRRAVTVHRSFRAFRAVYFAAAALMTVGPLVAVRAMGRLEPYVTPLGPVDPLTVTGAGTDAWVVGFVLFLASFVGLRIRDWMEVT